MDIRFEEDAHDSRSELRARLDHSNEAFNPQRDGRKFVISLHENGKLKGGLSFTVDWSWIFITEVWLDQSIRSQGWGEKLINEMERFGKEENLKGAYVESTSFQNYMFYEQMGFERFGTIEEMPPGHTSYYYRKYLK